LLAQKITALYLRHFIIDTTLEAYYREKLVFALLGGISNQFWESIQSRNPVSLGNG